MWSLPKEIGFFFALWKSISTKKTNISKESILKPPINAINRKEHNTFFGTGRWYYSKTDIFPSIPCHSSLPLRLIPVLQVSQTSVYSGSLKKEFVGICRGTALFIKVIHLKWLGHNKKNVHAFFSFPSTPFRTSLTPTTCPQNAHPTSSASAQFAMAIARRHMCPG